MSWSKGRETFTSRQSEIELKSIRGKIIANADFRWRKLWPHQSKTDKIAEISIYKKNVFSLTPPLEPGSNDINVSPNVISVIGETNNLHVFQ